VTGAAAGSIEQIEIPTPSLRFAARASGSGPLVLCLHGFPDVAQSYDHLHAPLAEAGFRVVAPWMRGYHPSAVPDDGDYSIAALGRDVLELMDALEAPKATLVAYDWGAVAAYMASGLAPERIERIVLSAIPHPRSMNKRPLLLLKAWHFFYFQLPWAAGSVRKRDFALLDRIYRQWSPHWDYPDDELAPVKECFSHPEALAAALGYYRALKRPLIGTRAFREQQKTFGRRIAAPGLMFAGTADLIPPEVYEDSAQYFDAGCEVVRVEDAGHFVHREAPDLFAQRTLQFLTAEG